MEGAAGFLMIDSPQKNLTPTDDTPGDEFENPEIAFNVWMHLLEWSRGAGSHAQLIIADNHPPDEVEDTVVVRYGGKYGSQPQGLIGSEINY